MRVIVARMRMPVSKLSKIVPLRSFPRTWPALTLVYAVPVTVFVNQTILEHVKRIFYEWRSAEKLILILYV